MPALRPSAAVTRAVPRRRPFATAKPRPIVRLTETFVIHTKTTTASSASTIAAPVVPKSVRKSWASAVPTMPPCLSSAASTISKYASEAAPSVAIMRGTLISRKTMAPKRATTRGNEPCGLTEQRHRDAGRRGPDPARVLGRRQRNTQQDRDAERGDSGNLEIEPLRRTSLTASACH